MGKTISQRAFSYRDDDAVPAFPDDGPVVFIDGSCGLCSRSARLIARHDRKGEFRICPTQSPTGRAVLQHYGLDADDPESWLYLVDGAAFGSLDAVIRAGARLGGVGWLLQAFRPLPRRVQDWLYRRIARNRYRLFGRTDICAAPDQALRERLIE